jgi:acyl carrier protein
MTQEEAVLAVQRTLQQLILDLDDAGVTVDPADTGSESIRRLGLSSSNMLAFLVAVEDRFGFSWEDDLDPQVLTSFDAMADHIAGRCSLAPRPA